MRHFRNKDSFKQTKKLLMLKAKYQLLCAYWQLYENIYMLRINESIVNIYMCVDDSSCRNNESGIEL